jgi:hypothetical protein
VNAIFQIINQFFYMLTAPLRWLAYLPNWFVSTPGRLLGLSLPLRVGCLVWFLLVACTVTAVLVIWWNEETAAISVYLLDFKFAIALLLTVIIPVVVYFWLKLWLEGDVSRFPDIDEAWNAGLAALAENHLDLSTTPLFLVVGAPSEGLARDVFAASFREFTVCGTPVGRVPLRWFADERGVYLVCAGASELSKLHALGRDLASGGGAGDDVARTLQPPATGVRGTLVAAAPARDSTPPSAPGVPADEGPTDEGPMDGGAARGTLVPGAARGTLVAGNVPSRAAVPASGAVSRQAAEEESERLRYVCQLLRRERAPVCPINGVLVVLPFEFLRNVMVAKDMPSAIRHDLRSIRDATRLRCPVTALVTGMERDSGFCELIRRVGTSQARDHRFGRGYDVGNPPTAENLDAFTAHACGTFEDWVYNLFRERGGLTRPGNEKLYAMLCRIRGQIVDRLRNVLVHGFGFDPGDKREAEKPPPFNGCYFAATGKEGTQAFVKSVFQKMLEMEEELEWTDEALAEDDGYQNLARTGMVINGVLALLLVAMFVWYYVAGRT